MVFSGVINSERARQPEVRPFPFIYALTLPNCIAYRCLLRIKIYVETICPKFEHIYCPKMQKNHFRLTCLAQKRLSFKLPSIHRFRCLVLSEIFTHLFITKNLESQWQAKFMSFWPTHFRLVLLSVRYDPLSSYVYYVSIALCLPPKFAKTIVFKSSWEDCIFPKGYENNTLCKICGVNRVHYGAFENSQWEGSACASFAPLRHYTPLRSHGIFLASHRREY